MLYLIIFTYNITFLIVVMVIITVFDLLITLLEGVEDYRFNKCTKVLHETCLYSQVVCRCVNLTGLQCQPHELSL